MNNIEVVLYGASGFTGKKTAQALAKRGIPFIAAGRNVDRLKVQLDRVEGLKSSDYEVVQVDHDANEIAALLEGKKVIFNLVGPYMQLGEPVVKAALQAGCHYMDATGEQDWMFYLKKNYNQAFKDKGLVLSPATSSMWNAGMVASQLNLENSEMDTAELVYTLSGVPSVASTLSFMRMCCQPQYYLEANELVAWPSASYEKFSVPGYLPQFIALPWSGGGESVWYADDAQVRNCKTWVTFTNQGLMSLLIERMSEFRDKYMHASPEEQETVTNKWAMEIAPEGEPMQEDPLLHRCTITCISRGSLENQILQIPMLGGYALTASMAGIVIDCLLNERNLVTGFTSACHLVGLHRFVRELQADGAMGDVKTYLS